MYKWFLAWRYLHTKLIAVFGIASVMLCVAMVLVVMSVMGGFLDTIRDRSRGLHAEIVLENGTLQGFPYYQEFGTYLTRELPDVVKVTTPVIYSYGIFRVPAISYTKPARVLGIRLDDYVKVNDFEKGLHYNHYYPGTTTLAPQQMPAAGYDEKGHIRFTPDLEKANKLWRATETDAQKIAAFDKDPYELSLYPRVIPPVIGARAFAMGPDGPGYVGVKRDGVIVGCELLNERRPDGNFNRMLARGADIALTVLPLTPKGNVTGEPPVRIPLRYTDDSRTGIYEIDSICVYVDFDMLQHRLAMDSQTLIDGGASQPRTNQILVGLRKGIDLNAAAAEISKAWVAFAASLGTNLSETDEQALSLVEVFTWEDLQRPLLAAVEKEKVLVTFLFSLISLVAIVLVGCIFYMIVEKKTRDIGILKAVGGSARGVAALFVSYAGAVGVAGAVLGVVIGCLFVWNINDIQDFLASLNPQLRVWSPEVYTFDKIPEVVKTVDVLWISGIAILSSMVGSVIPAILAGRVWPVQALRYE